MITAYQPGSRSARHLIAVVDHDDAVRESFSVLLEGVGYLVQTYESGLALLRDMPDVAANCLLLELNLPDLEGRRLVHRLCELGHDLPTVLMSTHPRIMLDTREYGPNVTAILQKPIEERYLFEAIEQAIVTGAGSA